MCFYNDTIKFLQKKHLHLSFHCPLKHVFQLKVQSKKYFRQFRLNGNYFYLIIMYSIDIKHEYFYT